MINSQTCVCGERFVFLAHEKSHKPAPITVATYDDGNIEIDVTADTYRVVGKAERATAGPLHRNHFFGCPAAKRFARGGGR